MGLKTTRDQYLQAVDAALLSHPLLADAQAIVTEASQEAPKAGQVPQPLRSAMRYSLSLPGKRLRPILLLAAFHLVSDAWESAMPYAMALEMIHTYSLIHDDLPAMDNDDLRRGQPTSHRVYGENVAILAGDGLYSLAMETMLEAALHAQEPRRAIAAMEEIARRAGVRGMIAGQTLDVKLEGQTPSEALVRYIHLHKTADLLTAPMVAGLTLAGASAEDVAAGERYGRGIGLAFQIVDDLLDLQGDVALLGKQTGMDAQRGKMTWPAVHGEARALADATHYVNEGIQALSRFGERAEFLQELARATLSRVS